MEISWLLPSTALWCACGIYVATILAEAIGPTERTRWVLLVRNRWSEALLCLSGPI